MLLSVYRTMRRLRNLRIGSLFGIEFSKRLRILAFVCRSMRGRNHGVSFSPISRNERISLRINNLSYLLRKLNVSTIRFLLFKMRRTGRVMPRILDFFKSTKLFCDRFCDIIQEPAFTFHTTIGLPEGSTSGHSGDLD